MQKKNQRRVVCPPVPDVVAQTTDVDLFGSRFFVAHGAAGHGVGKGRQILPRAVTPVALRSLPADHKERNEETNTTIDQANRPSR